MFALGDGVFGSAAAFAAFLDALALPLLLPENEVLLRLYFLGVVWLVVVIVTKFAGCGEGGCAGGTKKYMCSCQNLLDLRIQWILLVGGNLLNESRSSRYPRVEEYLRSSRREYRLTKHVVGNEKWVQE